MADLNAKQIEQIAKIRKESKTAKNYLFADCLCSCAVEGGALGIGASMISNAFDNAGMAKKIEINASHELTVDEKVEQARKIDRGTNIKKALTWITMFGLSGARGWIKGASAGVSIKHEDELAKKRIAAVIAGASKTTKDKK
jgi:hypothetical protein